VWGAYLHGVFDEHNFRRSFLNRLRRKKGWAPLTITAAFNLDKEFDKLAQLFRENMDMALLYKIMKDGA
ncbi:MAG: cobyric acid synthase CobQ, partial [Candidatus Omnitrophota bacterium]